MDELKLDDFFTPLENDRPYLKMGAQGFAGAGKTFTLALIAVGLYKRIGSRKPIVIFDTERSAKFLRAFFREVNIPVLVKKSRTLADLNETIRRCEAGAADIMLIDSLSHVWENWIEAYKAEKRINDIQFQHWGQIKPIWKKKFSDPFVTSNLHILMTGRAAFTYGKEVNEETGKKELVTTGVKMRVEGETAYEPDVLIEMSRHEEMQRDGTRKVWREAMILKDRSRLLDGKVFEQPTYKSFEPTIDYLLSDAVQPREEESLSDRNLVAVAGEDDAKKKERQILLEEIEGLLAQGAPNGPNRKRWIADALEAIWKTRSWTQVTRQGLETLKLGALKLEAHVKTAPKPEPEVEPVAD